eukprot:CAMPEP_0176261072 /NCGR_PEP_ID=MMETSP0121_2-20121125/39909_1 /TAXON_ID=160619 /ORGANISM="Kryptoperidinium foliaceum, Strain CCMP 1326" /LENGTH=96 /DNA_ID=CAMNT_0017601001 /DNA_START=335 /DNA_END=622 /DNA_ORIENTATION=-
MPTCEVPLGSAQGPSLRLARSASRASFACLSPSRVFEVAPQAWAVERFWAAEVRLPAMVDSKWVSAASLISKSLFCDAEISFDVRAEAQGDRNEAA